MDSLGRVVILRGVNLSGDAKVPPFQPCTSPADLDRVADLGFNVVRMVFMWEAYEPVAGVYNEAYLARLQSVAAAAWDAGDLRDHRYPSGRLLASCVTRRRGRISSLGGLAAGLGLGSRQHGQVQELGRLDGDRPYDSQIV